MTGWQLFSGIAIAAVLFALATEPGPAVTIEAEAFDDTCPECLGVADTRKAEGASGGRIVALRESGWAEYQLRAAPGRYELWLTCGGNSSQQAGAVSVNGGPKVLIRDESKRLPLVGEYTPEQRAQLEEFARTFNRLSAGVVKLAGEPVPLRISHAGAGDYSASFCVDKLELVPVPAGTKPTIQIGTGFGETPMYQLPKVEGRPAPAWLQEAETLCGWYRPLKQDDFDDFLSKFSIIIGNPTPRQKWYEQFHQRGVKAICYVTFRNWNKPEAAHKELEPDASRATFFKPVYEALPEHWYVVDESGERISPFRPDYHHGERAIPCLNCPGVIEAALAGAKAELDAGADGLFVDNVWPCAKCYGAEVGWHEHIWPEFNSISTYLQLMHRVRELCDSYDPPKVLIMNNLGKMEVTKVYADVSLRESYITSHASKGRVNDFDYVLDTARKWAPYIKAGRMVCGLSYSTGNKEDSYYTYACARLSDFMWTDWGASKGKETEILYWLRLGECISDIHRRQGVYYRCFENGFVGVNPDKEQTISVPLRMPRQYGTLVDYYDDVEIVQHGKFIRVTIPPDSGRVYGPAL